MQASSLVGILATAGFAYIAEPATGASIFDAGPLPQEVTALADTSASAGTVTGRVYSELNGTVVEFAVVEIISQDRTISALSDRTGRYRLTGVPQGSRLVRARALDHSELVIGVRVPPRGVVSLDLTLAVAPIELSPISARTSRLDAEPVERVGLLASESRSGTPADAELRVLESSPGMAELGLVQIIQAASAPDPDDPSSILYVRGATSDLKLVLLDGAPVYAPFHLGGLIQAFMPGVLGYSRPYVGGAPARFDGGLSYILDLGSRPGRTDRVHTAGALDMMSARGEVEGPLPGGSFLVGGRYIHGEGPDRLTGDELPYDYGDALLRMDWGIGRSGALSITGFFNREGVDLTRDDDPAGTEDAIADREPNEGNLLLEPPLEARPRSVANWGNVAGSVRYLGRALDSDLELTAGLGEFTTSLPLDGSTPLIVDGLSRRLRLAGVLSRWLGGARLELGASFDRVSLQHAARSTLGQRSVPFTSRSAGESIGAHAEATMRVLPAVMVRGGLRADYFLADGFRIAPRLSVGWAFLEDSEFSVAAGRYHQRVLSPETLLASEFGGFAEIASEGLDGVAAAASPSALMVSSSTHLVAGINSRALQHFVIGLEGYVKSFENLPVGPDLETSGFDFWLQRSAGGVSGWIGYSVAWYRPEYEGRKAVPRTLGRQLLSGGLSAQLISGVGVDLNLAYGVALPYTPIPQGDGGDGGGDGFGGGSPPAPLLAVAPSASGRTDVADTSPVAGAARGSYLRLDGTIYRTWVFNWSGVPVSISPYIRILNALDRRDGLFFQFDPDEDRTPVSLGAVPLIPLIGVQWGL